MNEIAEIDNNLNRIMYTVLPTSLYVKVCNIVKNILNQDIQIDTIILEQLDNKNIDDVEIKTFIISKLKYSIAELLSLYGIVIKDDSDLWLEEYNNILESYLELNNTDPYMLEPYSKIINNTEYDNITKLANILGDIKGIEIYKLIDNIEYVSEDVINRIDNFINTTLELEDDIETNYTELLIKVNNKNINIVNLPIYKILTNVTESSQSIADYQYNLLKLVEDYMANKIDLNTIGMVYALYAILYKEEFDNQPISCYKEYIENIVLDDIPTNIINKISAKTVEYIYYLDKDD